MLTRKRFVPPITNDPEVAKLANALSLYFQSLEGKQSLTLDSATGLDNTPVGANTASTGAFTTLSASASSTFPTGTWTPTVTAASGTFTTVSASGIWTKIGDRYFIDVDIVVTTNGTAATAVNFTLPFNATHAAHFSGRELGTAGYALTGTVASGSNSVQIVKYDSLYPAASGSTLRISGFFKG